MRNLPPVAWLGWSAIVAIVGSVSFFRRRAPAVALGLVGFLSGGLVQAQGGFDPTWWGDPPLVGLIVMGVAGLVFVPRAGPIYLLKASVVALVGVVIAAPLSYLFFHRSCPTWAPVAGVARARPWCNGVWDVVPVFRATLFVGAEAVVLLLLFVASVVRAGLRDVEDAPVNIGRCRLVLATTAVVVLGFAVFIIRTTPRPPRVDAEVAADGRSLSPHPAVVPTSISAGAAHGELLLHPGDRTAFSWFVNGVPTGSIARYVTSCDAVFASGPASAGA